MSRTVKVALPEAPPELYLAWVTFIVKLEQAIRARPKLRALAKRQGMVISPEAELARRAVVAPLTEQVERALQDGEASARPFLEGDVDELATASVYLEHWGEWLASDEVMAALSLTLPAPEVAALRRAVLKAIQEHASPAADPSLS